MRVEDSEEKFGKRWNDWTRDEEREHVAALRKEDCRNPLNLRLLVEHIDVASEELQLWVIEVQSGQPRNY